MRQDDKHSHLDRREFLRALSGGAAALATSQMLAGCGSGGSGSGSQAGAVSKGTPGPNVVILPNNGSLNILGQDANSVTLSGRIPTLRPGAVIVSGAGAGLLRKVSSAVPTGSSMVVQTTPATLEDLFQDASIVLKKNFTASDFAVAKPLYPGITINPVKAAGKATRDISHEISFANVKINDVLQLGGSAKISAGIDFGCQISAFHLDYLRFAPTLSAELSIKASASATFNSDPIVIEIAQLEAAPIDVQAGIVPVIIVPVVILKLVIQGSIELGAEVSMTATTTLQAGAEYRRGQGVTPVVSLQKQFDPGDSPNLYASYKLDITPLSPDVNLKLYDVTGPYVSLELPKLEFEYKTQTQPAQTEINGVATVRAAAGAKFDILSFIHEDYEIAAIEQSFQFLHLVYPFNGGVNLGIQ